MNNDIIKESNLDEEDFRYPVNNTYVIQSSAGHVQPVEPVQDKPSKFPRFSAGESWGIWVFVFHFEFFLGYSLIFVHV